MVSRGRQQGEAGDLTLRRKRVEWGTFTRSLGVGLGLGIGAVGWTGVSLISVPLRPSYREWAHS